MMDQKQQEKNKIKIKGRKGKRVENPWEQTREEEEEVKYKR